MVLIARRRPIRSTVTSRSPGSLRLVHTRAQRQVTVKAPDDNAGRCHAHAYIPLLHVCLDVPPVAPDEYHAPGGVAVEPHAQLVGDGVLDQPLGGLVLEELTVNDD